MMWHLSHRLDPYAAKDHKNEQGDQKDRPLKINTTKTKVMRFIARHDETIHFDNKEIEDVDNLSIDLGATVSKEGGVMQDLKNRISKARNAFTKLRNIWHSKNIRRDTKMRLYKTLVIPEFAVGMRHMEDEQGR